MKNVRAYKEYQKIIPHFSECTDETLREIIQEMRELCEAILNLPELAKQHNNKIENYLNEISLKVQMDKNFEFKPMNELDRIEMLTVLCFEVNKVTKYIDLNDLGKTIITSAEKERPKLNIIGIKKVLNKKYHGIYRNLRSKNKQYKIKGIEDYLKLEDGEEDIFDFFYEYTSNTEYWYKIKNDLLSQIIKELSHNPEKYKDFSYGFMIDYVEYGESIKEVPVFGIDIPGHEGTYQFHLLHPKEALYDLESARKIPHPSSKLVRGDRPINKKQWLLTINDIQDIEDKAKLEKDLEKCKEIAKKYTSKDEILEDRDNIFRKIHYFSLLLQKNLKEELLEVSQLAVQTYISEQQLFRNDEDIPAIDKEKFDNIIRNVKKYKTIFYSSDTMDSKVAIEVILSEVVKREVWMENKKRRDNAIKQGIDPKSIKPLTREEIKDIRNSFKVKKIAPGTAPNSDNTKILKDYEKGLYINTSKDGYYKKPVTNKRNISIAGIHAEEFNSTKNNAVKNKEAPSEMIKLNVDENIRETSICGLLSRYGFPVPKDVVKYANEVTSAITDDSRNAYILANGLAEKGFEGLNGENIIKLCKELNEKGETLVSASLTDEQLERYELEDLQKFYEEDIKKDKEDLEYLYLIEDKNKKIQIIQEKMDKDGNIQHIPEYKIEGQKIKRKIAINRNDNPGQLAFYVAYAQGADCCISINEIKEEGVQLAIQSNPQKCDLPGKLRKWAYRKIKSGMQDSLSPIKDVEDILNEKTRIIIGGRTRPDIYLKDRRENKEESYMEYTINELVNLVKEDEEEKVNDKHIENMQNKLLEILDRGINKEIYR